MIVEFIQIIFGKPHPMGGRREEVERKPVNALSLNEDLGHAAALIPQRGCQVQFLGTKYRVLDITWQYNTRDSRVIVELEAILPDFPRVMSNL